MQMSYEILIRQSLCNPLEREIIAALLRNGIIRRHVGKIILIRVSLLISQTIAVFRFNVASHLAKLNFFEHLKNSSARSRMLHNFHSFHIS